MKDSNIKDFKVMKSFSFKNKTARFVKQLFYISVLAVFFSACSSNDSESDNNQSEYYFKATLDGRKITYYDANFQFSGNNGRFEHIIIKGFETPYPKTPGQLAPNSLDFEIWRTGGNIPSGTYSTPTEPEMVARYAVQKKEGTTVYSTQTADDVFTVKIESISEKGIKGTFSGKVRNSSGEVVEVTEGSFNLPDSDLVNPS
ncbi:hypothetical protein ACE01P_03440 [Flavobacterium sp. HJSW_4]